MPNSYLVFRATEQGSAAPKPAAIPRYASVDALRGLSALAVLFFHAWSMVAVYPWPSSGSVTTTPDASFLFYIVSPLRWGFLGVSMFLILSGFCIHLPQARRKSQSGEYRLRIARFMAHRFWRLYPTYLIVLAASVLLLLIAQSSPVEFPGLNQSVRLKEILSHLTFSHIFFETHIFSVNPPFWSLALEFQFYVFYPLLIVLSRKLGMGRILFISFALSLLYRFFVLQQTDLFLIGGGTRHVLIMQLPARMTEWFLGAWLAELWTEQRPMLLRIPKGLPASAGVMLIFGGIALTYSRSTWYLTDSVFGLGFALLLLAALRSEARFCGPAWAPIVRIGIFSYTLYLIHYPLLGLISPFVSGQGAEVSLVIITAWSLVIIGIAAVVFRGIERPFLQKPPPRIERYFSFLEKQEPVQAGA